MLRSGLLCSDRVLGVGVKISTGDKFVNNAHIGLVRSPTALCCDSGQKWGTGDKLSQQSTHQVQECPGNQS